MRYIFALILSITLLLTTWSVTIAAPERVSVSMAEKVLITGTDITLGDVATIKTSDEALMKRLREIHIGVAAKPGFSQTLLIEYVKSRVRQQEAMAESIDWSGSQSTVVETKALHLSPQEFLSHAERFIFHKCGVQQSKAGAGECNIHIRPVNEIRPAILPYGKAVVKLESMVPIENGFFRSSNGIVPLRFTISVDGKQQEKRVIHFKVAVFKEVILAARMIDRYKVIEEDDLHLAVRNVASSPAYISAFLRRDDLIGKRSRRMISEDTIITEDMVETPPVIDRGELVTIVIESSAFRITAQGKAIEDGILGQIIQVANASSMKIINARVMGEKLVRVVFKQAK